MPNQLLHVGFAFVAIGNIVLPEAGIAQELDEQSETSTMLGDPGPSQKNEESSAAAIADESAANLIVVTAQRREQALERTPVAVAVVSGEALATRAIVTEADLQTAVPGLTIKASQTANQLNYSLRGQTVDAFSTSRPSVLPYFNEVQVGGAGSTAFYDLGSIQVLKGPQGTLFGRNSTGGAVLFTSAKPTRFFEGYMLGRVGNYDNVYVEGAANLPVVSDSVLLRIAGAFQRRDGFQFNLFSGERFGNVERENIRVSLRLSPNASITNDTVVDYAHAGGNSVSGVAYTGRPASASPPFVPTNILYSPALDLIFGPGAWAAYLAAHPKANPEGFDAEIAAQQGRGPFLVNSDTPNFHRSKLLIASNITTIDINSDMQVKNILGYVRRRQLDAGEFDGTVFGADDNGDIGRGGVLRQFSEELQLLGKTFGKQLEYITGIYYSSERNHDRSLAQILDLLPFIPPTNQQNAGVTKNETIAGYAHGTMDLGEISGLEGLKFIAGARYSSEQIEFRRDSDDVYVLNPNPAFLDAQIETFNSLSWQLGLEYQATSNLLLYGVTRRSNRSGGFNQFAPPLAGFGNEGGGAYRPEVATDIELGAKYRGDIGVPARFNLAFYDMNVKNIQRANYVQILGNLAGLTVNVPEAKITGFELDGSVDPANWLTLGGSLNYTNARFTDNIVQVFGNPPTAFETYPDTPEWSAVGFAQATVPVSTLVRASLRGDVYAQTSTFFSSTGTNLNPGTKLPGYTVANFRVGVEHEKAGLSLALHLKNAFNKVYYVGGIGFSSLFAVNTAVPGEPRTVLMEARWNF